MSKIIEVKNLTKKFKDFVAVDNVSFEVEAGEIFAFLGPNGAGKTTTIKMLTTLLFPSSGQVKINGFDVAKDQDEVRQSFGIVFQDQSLDDELTAAENMEYHGVLYNVPKAERRKKTEDLLNFVELWERKDDLVKNFSGGMKRRLEIARGLIHEPKILFLDEPTLGLDLQTRRHIWDYIHKLSQEKNMTVFFTTHYIEESEKMADRAAIINNGKISKIGTVAEIKEATGKDSLEEAFISLTGKAIRTEEVGAMERMRNGRRMWHK